MEPTKASGDYGFVLLWLTNYHFLKAHSTIFTEIIVTALLNEETILLSFVLLQLCLS